MNVLVIGSGGREHAFCWKLQQSPNVDKIYAAPGNAGMSDIAECIPIKADDVAALLKFAKGKKTDLTLVGPEVPLVLGIVDEFERNGLKICGPSKRAAQLEGSKVFSKMFMQKYRIPTAHYDVFTDIKSAKKYIEDKRFPLVIKADGLAAGKGVVIAKTLIEAQQAIELMLKKGGFGDAGQKILIEEFLQGEEASIIAISDGRHVLVLPTSQDHKRVFDHDAGPNTGGMGAYSPAPVVSDDLLAKIKATVITPTLEGLRQEGRPFKGFLYVGLMIHDDQPFVLEYNVRMGDPECQPILFRLKNDFFVLIEALCTQQLEKITLDIDPNPAVCIVMTAKGYPGSYKTGDEIYGLDSITSNGPVEIFHAGTERVKDKIVTKGGRVLGVTASGHSFQEAIERAYEAVNSISWDGAHYRRDIGYRALQHMANTQFELTYDKNTDSH